MPAWLNNILQSDLRKNAARLLSVDILQKASNLLLLPFFLRLMTQEEYGLYGYLVAIVTVLSNYLPINLNIVQGKLYYEYNTQQRRTMLFMVNVLLLFMLILVLGLVYLTSFDKRLIQLAAQGAFDYNDYRFIILPALLYATFSMMLNGYLIVSERLVYFQWYTLIRLILINPGSLLLLWFTLHDKVWVRFTYTYGVEVVVILLFAIPYFADMRFSWNKQIFKRISQLASPYIIGSVISALFFLSDRFVLARYRPLSDMGIYNLAVTVASIIFIINTSVLNAWFPKLFKEADQKEGYRKAKALMIKLLALYLGIGALLCLAVFVLLRTGVIELQYEQALFVLPLLIAGQIIQAINSMYTYLLMHFDRVKWSVFIASISSLVTIGLYVLVVPIYGFYGIAGAMLAVGLITMGIYYTYLKKI